MRKTILRHIAIKQNTYDRIKSEGAMHDSFDDVVSRLLNELDTLRQKNNT